MAVEICTAEQKQASPQLLQVADSLVLRYAPINQIGLLLASHEP